MPYEGGRGVTLAILCFVQVTIRCNTAAERASENTAGSARLSGMVAGGSPLVRVLQVLAACVAGANRSTTVSDRVAGTRITI